LCSKVSEYRRSLAFATDVRSDADILSMTLVAQEHQNSPYPTGTGRFASANRTADELELLDSEAEAEPRFSLNLTRLPNLGVEDRSALSHCEKDELRADDAVPFDCCRQAEVDPELCRVLSRAQYNFPLSFFVCLCPSDLYVVFP